MKKQLAILKLEFAIVNDGEGPAVFYGDKDVSEELRQLMGDDDYEAEVGIACDPDADYEAYRAYLLDKDC